MWFLFLKVDETIHKLRKWVGKTTKLPTGNNEYNYFQVAGIAISTSRNSFHLVVFYRKFPL